MLATAVRSAQPSVVTPEPQNSTNASTTPRARRRSVRVRARSVAPTPGRSRPVSRTPTTVGYGMVTGSPSMAAWPSRPPTPQPTTPRALIIGVWLSVATSTSGYSHGGPSSSASCCQTTRARASMLTWWMMPVPGGTTRKLRTLRSAHLTNSYRSRLRRKSISRLRSTASGWPYSSTMTEWSTVRSTGMAGWSSSGRPPSSARLSRMAAKSASAGRQVVSCSMIWFGCTGTSQVPPPARARSATSARAPGARRATFSSRTRTA